MQDAPAAVIFDMDGLMLDTESLAQRAWQSVAQRHDLVLDLALSRAMVGRNRCDCLALLASYCGGPERAALVMQASAQAFDDIVAVEGIVLKAGLLELLTLLEARSIPRAVATSTRRERARTQLDNLHLLHRFNALVGGDEVARGKPAPDVFIAAAARLGVAQQGCIVLEDSEPGVIAAFAAGMTPIMVPDLHAPSDALLERKPLVLRSLHDVVAHFRALRPSDEADGLSRVR